MKNIKPFAIALTLILLFFLATGAAWLYSRVDSALPQLEGKATLFGLNATVNIERDEFGIATIKAENRNDAAMALGFVHSQERFFQMDLLRRNSAGELSSLFGEMALDYDKKIRVHRFRERARTIVNSLGNHELELLKAYTRGVNQGLERLGANPFEYLLLQQTPVLWQEEDTVLSVFSMYLDLQYSAGERELSLDIMRKALPADLFAFLTPKGSKWDAAIDGSQFSQSPMPANFPKTITSDGRTVSISKREPKFVGSNNWSVSGKLSTTGSAIVANDMHLGIRVPNTWYRASLIYSSNDKTVKITGATLPGTPNVVVGSNGSIAWGFTNSYGDWSDVIVLETNEDKSQYLTPDGFKNFTSHSQMIAIKDQESIEIQTQDTIWGPVIGENSDGKLLAYRWVAHDINAVNLAHVQLESATNVDQAFNIAAQSGIPAQNMMVADIHGDIGWTIMGPIPRKRGEIDELPKDWSTGEFGWDGYLTPDEYPNVKSPADGRLWTANSRIVGGEMYKKIGNGGYALGARGQQIKQRLFEKEQFSEKDLLAIALDTEAIYLKRWQKLVQEKVLTEQMLSQKPLWQEAKQYLTKDTLSANVESVGYRIVKNFKTEVKRRVFSQLDSYLTNYDANFSFKTVRNPLEVSLWKLVEMQPEGFLTQENTWLTLFNDALDTVLEDMTQDQPLAKATWGQENAAAINHPLSSAIPIFGKYLNMPAEPLAGDGFMPRVDGGGFGASERMIVSPGHEESGIFHMPTSQAGHPWSPYFGKGHNDWVNGNPSPFLPGKTKYKLTLLSY
ncbi:penicillin acylase family protein [Thalassotalea sp. M1531]|uniref:Penicillin acylase family protein n=1 Tax=Thalassotalea algicola TaxID=2716224 RepID=A0A7Y0LC03_9GAMM|nr:penicillin acylase family protein [Thalassotalea algicola]NMP30901.1 penicillin acylase family protein [Thalassotalea algicola]